MEYLVDLSFTDEDRMELLRCVCDPGSSFYKVLDTNPPVIVSTFPGPVIYPFFEERNSVDYFYRIEDFYNPSSSGITNRVLYKFYSVFPPLFIQDTAYWFHNTIIYELSRLPDFIDNNSEAYTSCLRHFPIPYPKPHREDPFSIARDILYTRIFTVPEESESGYQSDDRDTSYQEPVINEDGSQQVKVDEETKREMERMFHKINEGEF